MHHNSSSNNSTKHYDTINISISYHSLYFRSSAGHSQEYYSTVEVIDTLSIRVVWPLDTRQRFSSAELFRRKHRSVRCLYCCCRAGVGRRDLLRCCWFCIECEAAVVGGDDFTIILVRVLLYYCIDVWTMNGRSSVQQQCNSSTINIDSSPLRNRETETWQESR